jgi:hypothetical protein
MNKPKNLKQYITLDQKGFQVTKHSSLLGAFVSYEENEVLRIRPPDFFPTELSALKLMVKKVNKNRQKGHL